MIYISQYGSLESLPYLRSLKITAYTHLRHFNIPDLLRHHHNVRELWIEAPEMRERRDDSSSSSTSAERTNTGSPSSSSTTDKQRKERERVPMGTPTDLDREMKGYLSSKLSNITFSGPQFTTLGETILKVSPIDDCISRFYC